MEYSRITEKQRLPIIGDEIHERMRYWQELMCTSRFPLCLVGPPGSGKTHYGKNLILDYAELTSWEDDPCLAYYVQVNQDTTKTALFMGHRMIMDDDAPKKGYVATHALISHAMEHGHIVMIDELGHAGEGVQTLFNGAAERNGILSIGDIIATAHPRFRLVMAMNDDIIAGNHPLIQSLATRLMTEPCDYPDYDSEVAISIAMAEEEIVRESRALRLTRTYMVPDVVAQYMTGYIRSVRKPEFPLSARQVAHLLIRINARISLEKIILHLDDAPSMLTGVNSAAMAGKIYQQIHNATSAPSVDVIRNDPNFRAFCALVTAIGETRFKEEVLKSALYSTPVAGVEHMRTVLNEELRQALF